MAIKDLTYFTVICDGCGADAGNCGDYSAWNDHGAAVEQAEGHDWFVKDDKHFCDGCEPSWCMECERDITESNPRCGDDAWSCANCHTDCDHEGADDVEAK